MSRPASSERGSVAIITVFAVAVLVVYIGAFIYQFNNSAPWMPNNHVWWYGFLHGVFAPLNFIGNLVTGNASRPIFQDGGSGWYVFWFLIGIGGLLRGGSSSSSRN